MTENVRTVVEQSHHLLPYGYMYAPKSSVYLCFKLTCLGKKNILSLRSSSSSSAEGPPSWPRSSTSGTNLTLNLLPCDWEVRGHYMCKKMPVNPVKRVMDNKRTIWKMEAQGVADPPPPPVVRKLSFGVKIQFLLSGWIFLTEILSRVLIWFVEWFENDLYQNFQTCTFVGTGYAL
jgi:hypothetical protein